MHGDGGRKRWAIVTLVLTLLVGGVVGILAYNAGAAHGLAISASAQDIEQGARAAVHARGYYGYGWHPWGFGFGFLTPLLFVFFWVFVARMLFWRWGGPWRYGYWHRGYGPGRWDRYDRDDRDEYEDDDERRRRRRDML